MSLSDTFAAIGIFLSAIAFLLAAWTLHKGNINSSAALTLTMHQAFSEAWKRYLESEDEDTKEYELAELFNTLETGATLFNQNSFVDRAKTMQERYLKDTFKFLAGQYSKREAIRELLEDGKTFSEARKFCEQRGINLFHQ